MRVNGLYCLEFRNSKIQDAARVIVFLAGDAAPHGTGQAPLVWAFAQFRNLEDNPGDALGSEWRDLEDG
jgi:hypothetical protein